MSNLRVFAEEQSLKSEYTRGAEGTARVRLQPVDFSRVADLSEIALSLELRRIERLAI